MHLRLLSARLESSLSLGNNLGVFIVNIITQPAGRIVGGGIGLVRVKLEEVALVRNDLFGSIVLVKEVLKDTPALLRADFCQAGL